MTDQKQEIHDLDKYLRGKGGANFEKYYKAGVSGLTDIDIAYVKNGYLIFNEEKQTTKDVLPLQYAQFMLFKAITELNPEKVRCFVSVFKESMVYVFSIAHLIYQSQIKIYNSEHTEYEPWRQNHPLFKADFVFTEKQYYRWFTIQTKACDSEFK